MSQNNEQQTKLDGAKTLAFLAELHGDIENISAVANSLSNSGFNRDFIATMIEFSCQKELGYKSAPSRTQILLVMQGIKAIEKHVLNYMNVNRGEQK